MSILSLALVSFWFILTFVLPTRADPTALFQWSFKNLLIPSTLITCSTNSVVVKPFNVTANDTIGGVPPYYMISLPVGGTPITDFIGTDPNNLSWTVTQPQHNQLLLSVVDSVGNPGGSHEIFKVVHGQSSACITKPPSTPVFTASANVSGNLEPCSVWGITVRGGSPPYVVTVVESNSHNFVNFTMLASSNHFTTKMHSSAKGQVIAAASDSEGRWASGTPGVNYPGANSKVDCSSFSLDEGPETNPITSNSATSSAAKRKHAVAVVVAVLLTITTLGIVIFFLIRRYRKRRFFGKQSALGAMAYPFPGIKWASDAIRAGKRNPQLVGSRAENGELGPNTLVSRTSTELTIPSVPVLAVGEVLRPPSYRSGSTKAEI